MHLPLNYKPVTLREMLEHFKESMPYLAPMMVSHVMKARPGSNITNLEFAERVRTLEKKGVVQFAITPNDVPSVFTAPPSQVSKEDQEFVDLMVSFWDVTGRFDTWSGKLLADGQVIPDESIFTTPISSRTEARPWLPPSHIPHWQVAMEQRVSALKQLMLIETLPHDHPKLREIAWLDMQDDLNALRVVDSFSFSGDVMHAIMVAGESLPHEAALNTIEIPQVRAGWYWFSEPFPVTSSPIASDRTHALLWSWDTHLETPALRFSTYVIDEKNPEISGKILPATKWLWPLDYSFHRMLALNTQLYRNAYGKGGPFEKQEFLIGEAGTLKVIAEMSQFFMQACLWFRQRVPGTQKKIDPKLTQEFGHVERHARKRLMKDAKLDTIPTVRVIALRKSAVTENDGSHASGHHLHVRFVVRGHSRLQPYGPGRSEKKLIWIDSYPKGPDDAPFKPPSERVFAVIR